MLRPPADLFPIENVHGHQGAFDLLEFHRVLRRLLLLGPWTGTPWGLLQVVP